MIDKETVRKMLENRACGWVPCGECPIDRLQRDKNGAYKWTRCCKKTDEMNRSADGGRKFRPRVIRLLTEWLEEQEKEAPTK